MLKINQIHHLDAIEGLKQLKDDSVDLIVTDPPYNIASPGKRMLRGEKILSTQEVFGAWDSFHPFDYDLLIRQLITQAYRVLKPGGAFYLFSAHEQNGYFIKVATERGFTYRNQLAMIKKNPQPSLGMKNWRQALELCAYLTKDKPKTFNFLSQQECKNTFHYAVGRKHTTHPTEKPLDLIKLIVAVSSNPGDLVVDPFMGSGTTAAACKQLKRRFLGFDSSAAYVKMAQKRLEAA